jgi:hypothetical protein
MSTEGITYDQQHWLCDKIPTLKPDELREVARIVKSNDPAQMLKTSSSIDFDIANLNDRCRYRLYQYVESCVASLVSLLPEAPPPPAAPPLLARSNSYWVCNSCTSKNNVRLSII